MGVTSNFSGFSSCPLPWWLQCSFKECNVSYSRLEVTTYSSRIRRKVRLIRGPTMPFFTFGISCVQFNCVSPLISNKLPLNKGRIFFSPFKVLCRRTKSLVAPKDNDAITGFSPMTISLSACAEMESCPSL